MKHAQSAMPRAVWFTPRKSDLARSFKPCVRSFEPGETGRCKTGEAGVRPCTQLFVLGKETALYCFMLFPRKSSTRLRSRLAARRSKYLFPTR